MFDNGQVKFEGFGKIPRLFREIVITEKIDGTNGLVQIMDWIDIPIDYTDWAAKFDLLKQMPQAGNYVMFAGSRKRYLSLEQDNYGFARWVSDNATLLLGLGVGKHFGEWWGKGINRGYDLNEKRFSLFNVKKWNDILCADGIIRSPRPECCGVVPVLYTGDFNTYMIERIKLMLQARGSFAAPGYMKPEGIVVFHTAGNLLFKSTLENDGQPKGTVFSHST